MTITYNILLYFLAVLFSPILSYLFIFKKIDIFKRLYLSKPDTFDNSKSIWIHGASIGELNIVLKLLPKLLDKYPKNSFVLSCTSQSGYNYIQDKILDFNRIIDTTFLPLDFIGAINRAFNIHNPAMIIILETEIWPNFLLNAKKKGIPVFLLNGRMANKSYKHYKRFKKFFSLILNSIQHIEVQTKEYQERIMFFLDSSKKCTIAGNIKENISLKPKSSNDTITQIKSKYNIPKNSFIFICISTRPGEEEIILETHKKLKLLYPDIFTIIAPRHIKRSLEIKEIIKKENILFNTFSKPNNIKNNELLLLDTFGKVSLFLGISNLAFVGGSLLPFGGHNLLEPSEYNLPVLFGPHTYTQKQSAEILIKHNCGFRIEHKEDLLTKLKQLIEQDSNKTMLIDRFDNLFLALGNTIEKNIENLPNTKTLEQ